jgi:hypothetical protein
VVITGLGLRWGFVVILVLPFVVGFLLLRSRLRAGAVVIGLFAVALVIVIVGQGGIIPSWPDALLRLVGAVSLTAFGLAIRVARGG